MAIELFKNKSAVIFLAIGFVCLSVGGYEAWNTKKKQIDNQKVKSEDLLPYQNISKDTKNNQKMVSNNEIATPPVEAKAIKVDVSGAVKEPGLYDLAPDARIADALDKAGGLDSKTADTSWVARNLNLATKLSDGDKIYIPTKHDSKKTASPSQSVSQTPLSQVVGVTQGVLGFQQSFYTPTPAPQTVLPQTVDVVADNKISINSASKKELDTLPGVGEVTAQKIIDNRPYATIEELKIKKAVNNSVFEKIKDKIIL